MAVAATPDPPAGGLITQIKAAVAEALANQPKVVSGQAYHRQLRAQTPAVVEVQGIGTFNTSGLIYAPDIRRDLTRTSKHDPRWKIAGVDEDRGRTQLQVARRRGSADEDAAYAEAAARQQQAYQQRVFVDYQNFEVRLKQQAVERAQQALDAAKAADEAERLYVEGEGRRRAYYDAIGATSGGPRLAR